MSTEAPIELPGAPPLVWPRVRGEQEREYQSYVASPWAAYIGRTMSRIPAISRRSPESPAALAAQTADL